MGTSDDRRCGRGRIDFATPDRRIGALAPLAVRPLELDAQPPTSAVARWETSSVNEIPHGRPCLVRRVTHYVGLRRREARRRANRTACRRTSPAPTPTAIDNASSRQLAEVNDPAVSNTQAN